MNTLTKEEIAYLRDNQNEITFELLDALRGTKQGKQDQLDILDMPRDDEMYYLDQYGQKISYNGNRQLKKPFTQHTLFPIHEEELERCQQDIHYFKDNYIKIVTPKDGVNFPDIRDYQNQFLDAVSGESTDVVCLMPRQCCQSDTELKVRIYDVASGDSRHSIIKTVTFEELFKIQSKDNQDVIEFIDPNNNKFVNSYQVNGIEVLTDTGYKEIEFIHRTIPFKKLSLELRVLSTDDIITLDCQENHSLIRYSGQEILAKDSLNSIIRTINGDQIVQSVRYSGAIENMFDLSIDSKDEVFYTNGILSHNSGKSVSTQIYLQWLYVFMKNINIGICQNLGPTQREFLDKTKQILINLPIWMQPGTEVWNKGNIKSDTGVNILTDTPNSDQFRGYSIHCVVVDECAFIRTSSWDEFQDAIFPSQSGLSWTKNILLSTQNGMNHFYEIVQGQREKSNGYDIFEVPWEQPPRWKKDGTQYEPEEFKRDIIKMRGEIHFNQNYQNEFIGSSHTLIGQAALEKLRGMTPLYTRDNKLKVWKDPEPGHKYIMTVDGAKDGRDYFTVNVFDITNFPLEQVQSQRLQINYLLMPDYILDWQESYNFQYLIIENNEGQGQSIQDVLYIEHEYINLHFDTNTMSKLRKKKEHPGFRMNRGNRPILLSTMKTFIEEDKLIIRCKDLIEEFSHFLLINGKYQADDGYHDDLVMGTALLFVPFIDINNFDGFYDVVKALYDKDEDQDFDFSDSIVFGDFNDGPEHDDPFDDSRFQEDGSDFEELGFF